jgi:putative ABC transport system permease protein
VRTLRRTILRDVAARKGPFAAVAITIMLGVALFGASTDAFLNLTASYEQLFEDTRFASVTAVGGPSSDVAAAGGAEDGVAATAVRSVADVPFRMDGDHELLGRALGLPPDGDAAVNGVYVMEGTDLDPARPNGVVVEQHLASHFDLSPGDRMEILTAGGWTELEVLGVVASAEYLWPARSRQEIFVPPDDFGVIFAPEALVAGLPPATRHTEALFRLAEDAPGGTADAVVEAALAAGAADTYTRDEQPSNAALTEDLDAFGMMSVAFPILFLGAAAFATFILLGRMITSQRAEIGTLRANGYRRRTILLHYVAFGLVIGLISSAAGVLLGALFAEVITRLYTDILALPARVVEVRLETIAVGLVVGIAASVLSAYFPARTAARISPAAAMAGPAPVGRGGRSILERVAPPLRRLPTRWLAALRGIGRNRRRSLSTIGGVTLAAVLILASWGMIDTVQILMDRQFNQVQRQDAQAYFAAVRPDGDVSDLLAVEGIQIAEPLLELPATVVGAEGRYSTALSGMAPDTTMHRFVTPDGAELSLPPEGLLLGVALRDELGVSEGDQIRLIVGDGGEVTTTVEGFVNEPLGTFAYGRTAVVAELAGQPAGSSPANAALVRFWEGADAAAMRSRLTSVEDVVAFVDSRAIYDLMEQYMGLFYAFVGAMLMLGGVMAFALIFNTMSANVSERSVEFAVLRTLGMTRASIGRLITAENLLLTLLGVIPGLIVGYLVAAFFMASFSSDMFSFNLELRASTLVLTALAIIAVGLLSQWPALRAVGRIDLGRVVRERSV